ncbi:hypothetical protein F2Q70_00015698 [Brassica cretica]|uniref:Uncharacterized protein n=1 Tax=Brassica cretica TaxID=69181 RepID=A0A8S9JDY3_BRACR|nr:hypothetical protein F2Q70_00015698 [Brassica cretica]KAF2579879.1 hypothetical protein F2Q68_00005259 [Brassica cretica]
MALDACTAAPRAAHGGQHDHDIMQDTATFRGSTCQSGCAASMRADTSCLCRQTDYQMVETMS